MLESRLQVVPFQDEVRPYIPSCPGSSPFIISADRGAHALPLCVRRAEDVGTAGLIPAVQGHVLASVWFHWFWRLGYFFPFVSNDTIVILLVFKLTAISGFLPGLKYGRL